MESFSQQDLEQALQQCEAEPIHQIGLIQPHGGLLVISADAQRTILQFSENLQEFLDLPDDGAIGKPLRTLVGDETAVDLEQLIQTAKLENFAAAKIQLTVNNALTELQAHVFISGEFFVLELVRDEDAYTGEKLPELLVLIQQVLSSSENEADIYIYFNQIAKVIRELTGFDRVMVYRFDPNWDGEVIAENRKESTASYLGLHFPAGDIPPQARKLYTTKIVRQVADIEALPIRVVPILNPVSQAPLDMTFSTLRAFSPVHIEYLQNIGVQASMSISLLQNGRLWGLVACHHLSAKLVSNSMQEALAFISRMVSVKLSSIEALIQRNLVNKAINIVSELLKYITLETEESILLRLLPDLQSLADGTGVIVLVEGKLYSHGDVPQAHEINSLISWLGTQVKTEVLNTDFLSLQYPPASEFSDIAAGVLATPLSSDMLNCIVWFREEKPRTVHWAGESGKGLVQDASGSLRLSPRKSFDAWTESWHGRSTPWAHIEVGVAAMLAVVVTEGLAQKSRLQKALEVQRLADNELRIAATAFEAQEGVIITDYNGIILRVNRAFTRITGYTHEEVTGKNPKLLQSGRHDENFYTGMWDAINSRGAWEGEIWNKRKNGEIYPEHLTITAVKDQEGKVKNYVGTLTDITDSIRHQDEVEHIAYHDSLTQLPNRALLAINMEKAIARSKRMNEIVCIVCIDLDGFKEVNDIYGHEAGDHLLVEIAQRMLSCVRSDDTVARLGGDEFVVVLAGVVIQADCLRSIDRILSSLSKPIDLGDGNMAQISGSVGYTIYPEDDSDPDTLLRHADQAMYTSKQSGKNRAHQFDLKFDTRKKATWIALNRIENGLNQGEFQLYVQPKVDLRTGRVAGGEALIRWLHPIRGLVPPMEFLPLIENHDLSLRVDEWVIREGLILLDDWCKQGLDISLSVNVGARKLRDKDFPKQLAILLKDFPNISPDNFELEIVESVALDDLRAVSTLIDECRTYGLRFSLDDFGTGYSSLTYLKKLEVNTLKIDQTFVRDMLEDESDMAIVRGIIGLAKAFQRETVAEGVETWPHAWQLKQLGCDLIQGYAIARPMPSIDIPSWIDHFKLPEVNS